MYKNDSKSNAGWLAFAVIPAVFFLFAGLGSVKAQVNITFNGKVSDAVTKQPLAGATVHIMGTTHEVVTDNNGKFHFLTGQRLPVTYSISYVGYQTAETIQTADGYINISLQQANNQLSDVVVVG